MAVVKGNAYGHGMIEIAKVLEENRVNHFEPKLGTETWQNLVPGKVNKVNKAK